MRLVSSLAVVLVLALHAAPASAQTDQGRIAGTVRDSSNAFAANTPVRVRNERTGEERSVATNDKGYFLVGGLTPAVIEIVLRAYLLLRHYSEHGDAPRSPADRPASIRRR